MALKDIVIQRSTIEFKGGSFDVHAINYDVINRIMVEGQREEVDRAIQFIEDAMTPEGKLNDANLVGSLSTIVMEMPQLAAKLIAYCADEPDAVERVSLLTLPVQLEAVLEICKLTFDGEDSIKKFMGSLIELVVMTRKAAKPAVMGVTEKLVGMKA